MTTQSLNNIPMDQIAPQDKGTKSPLLDLPPELRRMIFSFVVADMDILIADYEEPALLQVSTLVRAEAQKAWYEEADLTIMVGSNFADRARMRKSPRESFDLEHVSRLRDTAGLVDIDESSNRFLKNLRPDTIFKHLKFQVYNEASIKHTRNAKRGPRHSADLQNTVLQRTIRERESLMLESVSLSHTRHRLSLGIRRGVSHPGVYKPKPTMRYRRPSPYDAGDIASASAAAHRRACRVSSCENFSGFTLKDVKSVAGAFRSLTPRGKFQDAVFTVMEDRRTRDDECQSLNDGNWSIGMPHEELRGPICQKYVGSRVGAELYIKFVWPEI